MIDIKNIRRYYTEDRVFITEHAAERCRQRGIKSRDIENAVSNGEIIEQYPGSFPYPSCLIKGSDIRGQILHVCVSDEGSSSRIITAYYPDPDKWDSDFIIRKELNS